MWETTQQKHFTYKANNELKYNKRRRKHIKIQTTHTINMRSKQAQHINSHIKQKKRTDTK